MADDAKESAERAGEAGRAESEFPMRTPAHDLLKTWVPQAEPLKDQSGWAAFQVPPGDLPKCCRLFKESPETACNYLSDITAIDFKDHLQVVYRLIGLDTGARVVLKVNVPADAPEVDSVVPVWPTADWHEREAYDLLGVRFRGHPDLRRILTWEGYDGHPLRKDFVDKRPKRDRKVRA